MVPNAFHVFHDEDKGKFIQQSHGCGWLGDTRSQGICGHGIELMLTLILYNCDQNGFMLTKWYAFTKWGMLTL